MFQFVQNIHIQLSLFYYDNVLGQLTQSQLKLKDAYKNLIHTSR